MVPTDDILSRSDDLISRSDDIITRSDDLISRSDDMISRGNELLNKISMSLPRFFIQQDVNVKLKIEGFYILLRKRGLLNIGLSHVIALN